MEGEPELAKLPSHRAARRGSDGLTVERLVIMPIVQTRAEGLGDFMAGSCSQA